MPQSSNQAQGPFYDELASRRQSKHSAPMDEDEGEEKPVHFGWLDIFAMIIAAYQVLLPILGLFIGVMVVVYLMFKLLFT